MVQKARPIIEKWRALFAVTPEGEPPQRRLLLVGTDIVMTVTVLVIIGGLASMLIRYGDDAGLGAVGPSYHFFNFSRASASPSPVESVASHNSPLVQSHKHQGAAYICPQHPEVVSDSPGICPICGEPLHWSSGEGSGGTVLEKSAMVTSGQQHIKRVPLFGSGWVERLLVKEVGAQVKQGELLMELYAPEFGNGVDRESGVVRLYAPVSGKVLAIHAQENKFLSNSTAVIEIEDSSSLWLKSSATWEEAEHVHSGERVEVTLADDPKKPLVGEVGEIVSGSDAQGDSTLWLRFDDNPHLRALSQVDVRIYAGL